MREISILKVEAGSAVNVYAERQGWQKHQVSERFYQPVNLSPGVVQEANVKGQCPAGSGFDGLLIVHDIAAEWIVRRHLHRQPQCYRLGGDPISAGHQGQQTKQWRAGV